MNQTGKTSIDAGGANPVAVAHASLPVYDFAAADGSSLDESPQEIVPEYDLGLPLPLPQHELKYIREQHGEFCRRISAKLAELSRMKAVAELVEMGMATYEQLSAVRNVSAHFTLFKLDPLRGVNLFQISPQLVSIIVDRMMGGPGTPFIEAQDLGEIEKAVFEQAVVAILKEWVVASSSGKSAKTAPVILGYESHGRFVQIATGDTIMLHARIRVVIGECSGEMILCLPKSVVEAIFRRPSVPKAVIPEKEIPTRAVNLPKAPEAAISRTEPFAEITAQWPALEVTASQFLGLKVGDVFSIESMEQPTVRVCVENQPKFEGRPGTLAGRWAVEITNPIGT